MTRIEGWIDIIGRARGVMLSQGWSPAALDWICCDLLRRVEDVGFDLDPPAVSLAGHLVGKMVHLEQELYLTRFGAKGAVPNHMLN